MPNRWIPAFLPCLALLAVHVLAADAPKSDFAPPQVVSRGDPWRTLDELKAYAKKGNPRACFELAGLCEEGRLVPKDIPQALALFDQAGAGGDIDAWVHLAYAYHDGQEVPADPERALDYFRKAGFAGSSDGQYNAGAMLVSGREVKRDFVEGLAWLIVAGKNGADTGAEQTVRAKLASWPNLVAKAERRAAQIERSVKPPAR
jgi:TPR repeat protein